MKKVLFIHHAGNFSGAARSLSYLVGNLDREKFEPEILVIQKGTATDFFKKLGVKVTVNDKLYPFNGTTVSGMDLKRFLKNWVGFFLTWWRFPGVLKSIQPDIIHLNTTCLFTFAMVAKRVDKNIRVICHIREPLLDSFHGDVLRYFNEKYADHLVAISKYDASKFRATHKLKVVYNFVDTEQYRPQPDRNPSFRDDLTTDRNAVVFLYLSRVSPTNGALEFVTAASQLAEIYPGFVFVIAGFDAKANSGYNRKIKHLAETGKNIRLLEMTMDVIEWIAASDVMVSPFTTPHFSRSVVEAAAMGKPSIASDVGSQNELVIDGKTGVLYPAGDLESLKAAIVHLGTQKKLRETMGENARILALEKFSAARNIRETMVLFE